MGSTKSTVGATNNSNYRKAFVPDLASQGVAHRQGYEEPQYARHEPVPKGKSQRVAPNS